MLCFTKIRGALLKIIIEYHRVFFCSANSLNMPHSLSYFKYDCWNMQINPNQAGFQNTSPTTSCDTHTRTHTHYGATIHKSYYRIPTTKSIFHLCRCNPTPRTRWMRGIQTSWTKSLQANCYRAVVVRKSFSSKPHYWSDRIKHSAPTVYVCVCDLLNPGDAARNWN